MYRFSKNAFAAIWMMALALNSCDKPGKEKPLETPPVPVEIMTAAADAAVNGTSNCYIADPHSVLKFPVGVKGNSADDLIQGAASLSLLWQDEKGLVEGIWLDPETSEAYIKTADKSGNAVIAVKDESSQILWSWHIWVMDYDSANEYTTAANSSGTTWTFMDRNLGAVSTKPGDPQSYGMIYQWGRKDPFTAPASFTVMNEDYSYVNDGEKPVYDIDGKKLPAFRTLAEYHGTIEKSIQNPTVFYAMTYKHTGETDEYGEEIVLNDYRTKDWVNVSDDDYWGGVSQKKTIWDPCPVGYKVPVCDPDGNTPYAWLKYASMTWDNGAHQDGQFFPATGTRVYASGGLDHQEANPYSGMWIGTAGKASADIENHPELYGQYMFIINGKRTFKVNKDARSQGMSLRCVRE